MRAPPPFISSTSSERIRFKAGVELLRDHGGDGDHGQAAVVELAEAVDVEPLVIFSLGKSERVESAVVAGGVVVLHEAEA